MLKLVLMLLLFGEVGLVIGGLALMRRGDVRKHDPHRCVCGYSQRGLRPLTRCPECGRAILVNPAENARRVWKRGDKTVAWGITLLVIATVLAPMILFFLPLLASGFL